MPCGAFMCGVEPSVVPVLGEWGVVSLKTQPQDLDSAPKNDLHSHARDKSCTPIAKYCHHEQNMALVSESHRTR
jgi:hypothetical protein